MMGKNRIAVFTTSLFLLIVIVACTPINGGTDVAQEPEVLVFPSGTEQRLISSEEISQNNCESNAATSHSVERSHKVLRILELGTDITVDANGQASIPGIGEIGVGVAVATHYQVSYGTEDTVSRSVTVTTEPWTNTQYTIRQYEVWETGEILVSSGGLNQRIPYSFRKDFSIERSPLLNFDCPPTATPEVSLSETAVQTPIPETPSVTTSYILIEIPVNSEAGADWIVPTDGNYSFSIDSGAYNGWATDSACLNAFPDSLGCWHTRVHAYLGCEVIWEQAPGLTDVLEPAKPSFMLGDISNMESLEIAENYARGMPPYSIDLLEGDCIRFVVVDGYNPDTGYTTYADNRGDAESGNMMRIRATGPG